MIRSTDGAIEPTESDWTKLKYKWSRSKATLELANPNEKLFMRNLDGKVKELIQKDPKVAQEILGVWQTVTGSEVTQMNELKKKISQWSANIIKSGINRNETLSALKHAQRWR